MDYAERCPPAELDGLVAAVWTTAVNAPGWVEHEAVPDGCIEIIRRDRGRSIWRTEQPALFVTGLALTSAQLRFSGDARFTGIRLWPWTWHLLGGSRCTGFHDDWRPLDPSDPLAALLPEGGDPMPRLVAALAGIAAPPLAAIRSAGGVAQLGRGTGLSHRTLQRLCAREFGMPPCGCCAFATPCSICNRTPSRSPERPPRRAMPTRHT